MLRPLIDPISREMSAANCMANVQTIIRHHRIQACPGYTRPRRSVRFLHTPEMTGTFTHLVSLAPGARQ